MRKLDVVEYAARALGVAQLKQKRVADRARFLRSIVCAEIAASHDDGVAPGDMTISCLRDLAMRLDWAAGAPRYLVIRGFGEYKTEARSFRDAESLAKGTASDADADTEVFIVDRALAMTIAVINRSGRAQKLRWV